MRSVVAMMRRRIRLHIGISFLALAGFCAQETRGSCSADLNGDGVVDLLDLMTLLDRWGPVLVGIDGNLDAAGNPASTGSVHESRTFFLSSFPDVEMWGYEDLTVLGNDLYIDDGAGGSALAIEGGRQAIVTVQGVQKGGHVLPTRTFGFMSSAQAILAGVDGFGSNMYDFLYFLHDVLGLHGAGIDFQSLGGAVDIMQGKIVIRGNEGIVQDLDLATANFQVSYVDPLAPGLSEPFVMTKVAVADGESAAATFEIRDSLCVPVTVTVSLVLQGPTPSGPVAFWLAESDDTDVLDRLAGIGLIEFDQTGRFSGVTNSSFTIVRHNGAFEHLQASFDLTPLMVSGGNPSSATAVPDDDAVDADFNSDGIVGAWDLLRLLAEWD